MSNLAYNCVDHPVKTGAGTRTALITENERGEQRTFTYAQLHDEVKRVGAALRGLGIKRGDRVAIYMPTSAEAIVLMLAAVRTARSYRTSRASARRVGAHPPAVARGRIATASLIARQGRPQKQIVDDASRERRRSSA